MQLHACREDIAVQWRLIDGVIKRAPTTATRRTDALTTKTRPSDRPHGCRRRTAQLIRFSHVTEQIYLRDRRRL